MENIFLFLIFISNAVVFFILRILIKTNMAIIDKLLYLLDRLDLMDPEKENKLLSSVILQNYIDEFKNGKKE